MTIGPAQPEHVDQRRFRFSIRAGQQVRQPVGGHVQQMLGKRAVLVINLPPGRILHAESLNRRHDDDGLSLDRRAGQPQRFFNRHHLHRAARQFQCAAVGMARIAQRVGGLVENRVAGHEPKHDGAVGAQQFRHGESGGVAGQQGFSAAGRHAQADIRHLRRQAGGAAPECKARAAWRCAPAPRGTPLRDSAVLAPQCRKKSRSESSTRD